MNREQRTNIIKALNQAAAALSAGTILNVSARVLSVDRLMNKTEKEGKLGHKDKLAIARALLYTDGQKTRSDRDMSALLQSALPSEVFYALPYGFDRKMNEAFKKDIVARALGALKKKGW